jgi:hypothetical protein
MFFSLLGVTLFVAVLVATITVRFFSGPVKAILTRVVSDEFVSARHRYIVFAAYVVGISGGVSLYKLEQYVNAPHKDARVLELTTETWTLEVYRTIIQTLQSIAWMLLVVFVVALIAFVIVRVFETRCAIGAAKADEDVA